jgi:hypothetical protein
MSGEKAFSWMIRPKGFTRLLGAEYELMRKAGPKVVMKYYISSITIVAIALISFLSVRYAIELLFHVVIVEILLSLFLSLLLSVMYIFLINTFTKDVRTRNILNVPNVVRTGFVVFMAFIISKPLQIYFYKNKISNDLVEYRQKLNTEHSKKIDALFDRDIDKLKISKARYERLNKDSAFQSEIQQFSSGIAGLEIRKQELKEASELKISKGAFFIYRIQKVSRRYPLSWLICLSVIVLFLLPGYLIYTICKEDDYFKLKDEQDKSIIQNAYAAFVDKYVLLFKEKHQLEVTFYTPFEDAPFNTTLKKDHKYQSSKDFHNKYNGTA